MRKADSKFENGIWLGKTTDSDEHIVATNEKVIFARSVKMLPAAEVPADLYANVMKWTPWVIEGRARGKAPRGELLEEGAGVAVERAGGAGHAAEEGAGELGLGARMPTIPARSARGGASTKLKNLKAFWDVYHEIHDRPHIRQLLEHSFGGCQAGART